MLKHWKQTASYRNAGAQGLSGDRRSTTPFARDFSRRLLRCHKLAPDTGQVAWTQAGRAGSGRKARTPCARPTTPQRKTGALGPPASRSRPVPSPSPRRTPLRSTRGPRGPRGPARRLHPGSAPGTTDRVKQARRALTVHGLSHGVQVGRGRRARAATARHGEEKPPTGGRRPDPELEHPPLGRAIPPRGCAHPAQAPPSPPRPRPLAQSADARPR